MMGRPTICRSGAVAVLTLSAMLALGRPVPAQHTADPYKPWNSQYESYIYPQYPNGNGVYSNQAALQLPPTGLRGANQFRSFLDDLELGDNQPGRPYSSPTRAIGIPYTRAFRQYDSTYDRIYTPNKDADEKYNATRQARDEAYADYMRTKDPKERGKLRREYDLYNRQTLRALMRGGRGSRATTARTTTTEPPPPPVTAPSRSRRLPSISVPSSGLGTSGRSSSYGSGTGTGRTGSTRSGSGATSRSPSEILRRSERLDREKRSSSRGLTAPPPVPER